jgi:ABC-type transport system involved in multi-copper enzyme maturation permease subunit
MAGSLRTFLPLGPIFVKELRVASRRKRNHLLRLAYLGVLALVVLLASLSFSGQTSLAARVSRQSEMAMLLFGCFVFFNTVAMILIGPLLTANAICGERSARTFHVLLMTPITTWQIVGGKLSSSLLQALLLIGLTLPVLGLVRLAGGIELQQLLCAPLVGAAVVTFTASVGLLMSVLSRRALTAILLSYGILLLLYVFLPILLMVAFMRQSGPGGPGLAALIALNPFFASAALAIPDIPRLSPVRDAVIFIVTHFAAAAVVIGLSAVLVRRLARREGEGAQLASIEPQPTVDTNGAETGTFITSARAAEVGGNPVLWREVYRGDARSQRRQKWAVLAALLLALASYAVLSLDSESALQDSETQIGYALLYAGCLMVTAAMIGAASIATERETDSWTLLLATPLTGRAILWGKYAGILRRLALPVGLIALHFVAFVLMGILSGLSVALVLLVTITFSMLWAAVGLVVSLWSRSTTVAAGVTLALGAAWYVGVPLVLLLGGLASGNDGDTIELSMVYHPIYYLANAVERFSPTAEMWKTVDSPIPGERLSAWGFVWLCAGVCAAHLAAAYLLMRVVSGRFDRIVGRSPTSE